MGLDSCIYRKIEINSNNEEDDYKYTDEIAYWRKCWGVNNWLKEKVVSKVTDQVFMIDTSIFYPILDKMKIYLNEMLKKARESGYFISEENDLDLQYEELRMTAINLYEEDGHLFQDYEKLSKILLSFKIEGLDYSTFENSIWSPINTFIQTYFQFKNIIDSKEDKLFFLESY